MDVEYELSAKRVERNVLEVEVETDELWEHDEYYKLQQRIAALEKQVEGGQTGTEDAQSDGITFGSTDR